MTAPGRRIGLARSLSKLGYCSRSEAVRLISSGQVRLNGSIIRNPEAPVNAPFDRIEVNDSPVQPESKAYLMMNKPRGLVTTARDEKGRDTVYSLLPDCEPWLAPVGRLDKASEGLLLMTNDSEWAARITAPDSHLPKTYHVQISAQADSELLARLVKGVQDDGEVLRASAARKIRSGDKNSWIEIVLDEGKNRQIRRMCSVLGLEVKRLVRVAIGGLQLGNLEKGKVRKLTPDEVRALQPAARVRGSARSG